MTASIDMPGIGFISFDAIAAAVRIADSAARSDIECHCNRDAGGWYFIGSSVDPDGIWLPDALNYLDARGVLVRDDRFPQLVKFKEKT